MTARRDGSRGDRSSGTACGELHGAFGSTIRDARRGGSARRRTGHDRDVGAAQRRALAAIVSNTGWTSVGELEMTRRISLVAVCCSSVSVRSRLRASSSLNSRTFSMAITAWSAKVFSSSICVSVNGPASGAPTMIAPIDRPRASSGRRAGSEASGERASLVS